MPRCASSRFRRSSAFPGKGRTRTRGGNKYRLVMWINYPYRVIYVRFIGTHAQYDRIDAQAV